MFVDKWACVPLSEQARINSCYFNRGLSSKASTVEASVFCFQNKTGKTGFLFRADFLRGPQFDVVDPTLWITPLL
jgi:hypothetical protein